MTTLYVAEFAGLANTERSDLADFSVDPSSLLREQTIAIGATSTPLANPFLPQTQWVEISTDSICSIAFAKGSAAGQQTTGQPLPAPVATTTNCRLAANERIRRYVKQTPPGSNGAPQQVLSVAVIQNT